MSKAKTTSKKILKERIQRFVDCNSRIREATLESERDFLKAAGDISSSQLQIILAIGDHEPCAMNHIASLLHFSKANVTQMTNRLIKKRFIKKIRCLDDRRIVKVSLLQKGRTVVDLNREHVERVAKRWFSVMTDEEQEGMLLMLERFFSD